MILFDKKEKKMSETVYNANDLNNHVRVLITYTKQLEEKIKNPTNETLKAMSDQIARLTQENAELRSKLQKKQRRDSAIRATGKGG